MTTAGATGLGYDGRGNLTSSGSSAYTYSTDNRMQSAPGITMAYEPAGGQLLRFNTAGADTRFSWSGSQMISEYGTAFVINRRYVPGPGTDEPVVWYEGSGTSDRRWLHADERGSIVAVSDGSGSAIAVNRYDEYGIPASTNIGRFQYTGQAWLPELGMYYYKARIYSPNLGRFMQADPIGYSDGMNLYNYVGSDPTNRTDPTGLCAKGEISITETGSRIPKCVRLPSNEGGGGASGGGSGASGGQGGPNVGGPMNGETGCPGCISPGNATTAQLRASILAYGGYYENNKWVTVSQLQIIGGMTLDRFLLIASLPVGIGEARLAAAGIKMAAEEAELVITKTVAKNIATRPFVNSQLTIREIQSTGMGVADKYIQGAIRYEVPGSFRGSNGVYELVIHPESNTIYHFLFRGIK